MRGHLCSHWVRCEQKPDKYACLQEPCWWGVGRHTVGVVLRHYMANLGFPISCDAGLLWLVGQQDAGEVTEVALVWDAVSASDLSFACHERHARASPWALVAVPGYRHAAHLVDAE